MSDEILDEITASDYKYGFTTDIESDTVPPGLNEDVIRLISEKKNEPQWMLDWRLDSYKSWLAMVEPEWHNVTYTKPDFQAVSYYSAPNQKKELDSLDEVAPELLLTF